VGTISVCREGRMTTVESSFEKVRPKMVAARIAFMGRLAKFGKAELAQLSTHEGYTPLRLAYHLYIADGLALDQMQQVQNEENPLLEDLAVEVPRLLETAEPPASLDAVLGGLVARREEIFEYLKSLPEEAWERPFHTLEQEGGKFYQLVDALPQFDQEHAQQLAVIKAQKTEE
jgi:hypothetical protein